MTPLTSRERVLAAVNRRRPDRVPRDISWGFTPAVLETFRAQTGADDPEDYFRADVRFVGLDAPPERAAAEIAGRWATFAPYYADLPAEAEITAWGTAHLPGDYYHFTSMLMPMRGFTGLAEFEAYPFPNFEEPWRRAYAAERIAAHHARGLAVGAALATTIFETAWQLRGMEELFRDCVDAPELAAYLLDRITETRRSAARFFAQQDADVLILGDDVSMQTGMLMSPPMWRRWFKGRLASIIAAARAAKPDMPVFYHSDGDPSAIIPDLIEVGVTILNPVQPECIDPVEVKRKYGDRLALWGTIGTQTTMPFGTPVDVRREVRQRIETLGGDGGLVLGPTHTLEPDVPWENIVALYAAIDEYGTYR
jgi:uroporphyrinogen decarboxylase